MTIRERLAKVRDLEYVHQLPEDPHDWTDAHHAAWNAFVASHEARPKRAGVYFLGCHGFIKIGKARAVNVRIADLRRACPLPLKVLGWIPCAHQLDAATLEATYHQRFASDRAHGEWFRDSDRLRAAITTEGERWPN